VFTYNLLNLQRTRWEGAEALAPGKHTIAYDFRYDGLGEATLAYNNMSGVGRGGTGTLKVDGKVVSIQKQERTPHTGGSALSLQDLTAAVASQSNRHVRRCTPETRAALTSGCCNSSFSAARTVRATPSGSRT